MRLLVLGADGMLGHKICHVLGQRMDVCGTVRQATEKYGELSFFSRTRLRRCGNLVGSGVELAALLDDLQPEVIVNCIGVVKQSKELNDPVQAIRVNSLLPLEIAKACRLRSIRFIHLSTDCVFSGRHGGYTEADNPDPEDLYGCTKLLGEVNGEFCLTLRTSILGWEISRKQGLLSWLASQRGKRIPGYVRAVFSGLPSFCLAGLIGDLIERETNLSGIYHVSTAPISKHDLLCRLVKFLGWEIEVDENFSVCCDRSLDSARFRKATGWEPPPWDELLQRLVEDQMHY